MGDSRQVDMAPQEQSSSRASNFGLTALGCFFIFGALMSGIAALTLLFPNSPLDPVWKLNPRGHAGLRAIGPWAIGLMILVSTCCGVAAIGLWTRRRWGYWTALVVLVGNISGDASNALIAHDWRTLVGLPIGAFLIWFLINNRALFD
jgi:hypothetical protein